MHVTYEIYVVHAREIDSTSVLVPSKVYPCLYNNVNMLINYQ